MRLIFTGPLLATPVLGDDELAKLVSRSEYWKDSCTLKFPIWDYFLLIF